MYQVPGPVNVHTVCDIEAMALIEIVEIYPAIAWWFSIVFCKRLPGRVFTCHISFDDAKPQISASEGDSLSTSVMVKASVHTKEIIWLVVEPPLWKKKASWDYCSQYMED